MFDHEPYHEPSQLYNIAQLSCRLPADKPDRFFSASPFYVFSFFHYSFLFGSVRQTKLAILVSFWARVNIVHHVSYII